MNTPEGERKGEGGIEEAARLPSSASSAAAGSSEIVRHGRGPPSPSARSRPRECETGDGSVSGSNERAGKGGAPVGEGDVADGRWKGKFECTLLYVNGPRVESVGRDSSEVVVQGGREIAG